MTIDVAYGVTAATNVGSQHGDSDNIVMAVAALLRVGKGRRLGYRGMQISRRTLEMALEQSWSRLFGYALSLTGDADQARDVIQQSAVNALASRNAPVDPKAVRAWLFKIVRHVWIDQYRRKRTRTDDGLDSELEPGAWDYDNRVIAEITVRQGLGRIHPDYREIIELIDIWGFQYADVSTVLNIPIGTVMSRLSRARLSLLDAINGDNVRPIQATRGRKA